MIEEGTFPDRIGRLLRLEKAPTLATRPLHKASFAVIELTAPAAALTEPISIPSSDAYVVALQFQEYFGDVWVDRRQVIQEPMRAGDISFYDLRSDTQAKPQTSFHALQFYLPRTSLATLTDTPVGSGSALGVPVGIAIHDGIIHQLGHALRPAFARPNEANSLFIDYVLLAFASHFTSTYLTTRKNVPAVRGGLAPWQLRRAQAMLEANIDGNIGLASVADECGLSASYFARAFKRSTGKPPHMWLTDRRVDRAKELILKSSLAMAEVAAACGFADQAHFTRVFVANVGTTPSRWRRERTF
jgi:AraC family transcriptional regulator